MAIHFACPSCGTPYKVSDLTGGRVIHCQACGQRVRVPDVPQAVPVSCEPLPASNSDIPEALSILEPVSPPATVVIYRPPRRLREYDPDPPPRRAGRPRTAFRCPYCGTSATPEWETKISLAGWLIFLFFLAFICLPLCWIGLLMKEHYSVCSECGVRLD